MKRLFLLFAALCCMATMQAEIVHHEKCDPTYLTVGYTQECWEDTENGNKLYADEGCTTELNRAVVVTYKKLRKNPVVSENQTVSESTEKGSCIYNWAVEYNWEWGEEYEGTNSNSFEFKVYGEDVANARIKWWHLITTYAGYYKITGTTKINIYINNNLTHQTTANDIGITTYNNGQDPHTENWYDFPLPNLQHGDVVRVELNQECNKYYYSNFLASLEYTSSNGGDPDVIVIKTGDKRKFKGVDDPELTYTVVPASSTEKVSGINLSRDPGEELGVYTIHASQAEGANPGYEIFFYDGKLEIVDGVYHTKDEPYSEKGLIYIQDCWEETKTGKYYADAYLDLGLQSYEAISYPKLPSTPITATYGFTLKDSATYDGVPFDWAAETTYEKSKEETRIVDFTVTEPIKYNNARLVWYISNASGPGFGYRNHKIYVNDVVVDSKKQATNETLPGGVFYVPLSDLKIGDRIKFEFGWEGRNGVPTVAACLQYVTTQDLCLMAQEDGSTVQLNKVGNPYDATLEYCTSTGRVWQPYTFGQTITLANEGDKVWFCNAGQAKGFSKGYSDYYQFAMTGSIAASGNIMSLLDKDHATIFPDDDGNYETPEDFYYFLNLFSDCTSLTSAPELPATKLTPYCYQWMFNGCTGLTEAPELPATTLSDWCYSAMFEGCTGLEKAPALLATTLESNCYAAMFRGCTGLTEAPELPATSLAGGCYAEMFRNCTSLETAPALPATTLVLSCYDQMFRGCTKLNRMRVAFTDWTNNTTYNWLDGVASTGTFASPAELDKTQRGASYIPENWMTVQYSCTIAVGSSDESKGTVSGGGTFMYGEKVTLTATPAEGCAFKQWSDGTTANPYVFTATEDVTLTATFVKVYEVQATSQNENEGSVSGSGIYEEGTEVTLTATPAENYVFEKWSDGTTANPYVFTPTKDVTLTALFKEYTRYFTDGTEYTATESKFLPEVIYTRTFSNTEWQALYVPFSMDYDEWSEKYDIAEIHNFIEYDDDDNGEFDRTYLVVLKLTSGSTEPNYPYLIRAKETGMHSLVLQDKTLEAAESTSIDCRSVKNEYTFTGTYTEVTDMYANGYWALSGGALNKANAAGVTLNPQRWYMEVTSRTGGAASVKAQSIQVLVDGEEGIETPSNSPEGGEPVAYDLMGRMVSVKDNVRGVNIVNGRKLIK